MNILTNIFLYASTILLLVGCQYNEVVERWDNGNIKKEIIPDGAKKYEMNYYQNGNRESEGIVIDTEKDKDWIYYHPNGVVKQRSFYNNGKPFDYYKTFYQNGNKRNQGFYNELGLKTGEWMNYWENGRIKTRGFYEDGKKINNWTYFNISGELEEEYFLDDRENYVTETSFNEQGAMERDVVYWTLGKIKEERYKIGSNDQEIFVTTHYENGIKEKQGSKFFEREIGSWSYWFSDGKKKAEGAYLGIDVYVSDIPKKKLENKLPYVMHYEGIKIGEWTYWDKEGKKILVVDSKLENGKIIDKVLYERLD